MLILFVGAAATHQYAVPSGVSSFFGFLRRWLTGVEPTLILDTDTDMNIYFLGSFSL